MFAALDAEHFRTYYVNRIEAVEKVASGRVVAIDGKTLRRSHDRKLGKEALQRLFDDPEELHWVECDFFRTVEESHGRIETRECWTTSDAEYLEYIATLAECGCPGRKMPSTQGSAGQPQ